MPHCFSPCSLLSVGNKNMTDMMANYSKYRSQSKSDMPPMPFGLDTLKELHSGVTEAPRKKGGKIDF